MLLVATFMFSGCSTIGQATGGLFSGLGHIVGGAFGLIGKALQLADKVPKVPGLF